ncbi:hypothetical protein [Ancylobacter sp. IITR112]|uniref:hypothetical protein n=1 Tax=Ancylobacter sp. IITR112 TaxID=3138073 RepID=UPI00352A0DFC
MDPRDINLLVDAAPLYGTDAYGEIIRRALVNRLMGALPGRIVETDYIYTREGDSWRHFFFPDHQPGPLYAAISPLTGLDDAFWSGFATALLCASIRQVSHETARMVDGDKVDRALADYNRRLQESGRLVALYAHVLSREWAPLATITSSGDTAVARSLFLERLASPQWRSERGRLQRSYDWPNFDWDIFHYWVKLLALGTEAPAIDAAADDLARAFTVPESVAAGQWRSYFQWMRPPADPLRMAEIAPDAFDSEAARGILMTRFTMSPGRGMDPPAQNEMPEGYAASFMLPGQPGTDYRVIRRESCFGGGTEILMADGSHRPIESLEPGALVATPSGPAKIAVLVRTPRAGRPLFRINGGAAGFTEAHPFLAARQPSAQRKHGSAAFFAVSPALLGQTIPTLSWLGVDELAPGVRLRGWEDGTETAVAVASVEREEATAPSETVYDVVVWPDRQADCQYIVRNGNHHLVVGAEIPLLSKAPLAMAVVLTLLVRLAPLIERQAGRGRLASFETMFADFLSIAAHQVVPAALRRCTASPANGPAPAPAGAATLQEAFERLQAGGNYNAVLGRAAAMIVRSLGPAIDSAIALGYRQIAQPQPSGAAPRFLALSLQDIAFRKWARADFEQAIDVTASLDGAAFAPALSQARPTPADLPFLRRLNAVSYLEAPAATPAGTIEHLHVEVAVAGRPAFFGRAVIALSPGTPLRRYGVRLVDGAGKPAGRLSFDLRRLNDTDRAVEEAGRLAWTDAAMDAFARRLGPILAEEAALLFASLYGAPGAGGISR